MISIIFFESCGRKLEKQRTLLHRSAWTLNNEGYVLRSHSLPQPKRSNSANSLSSVSTTAETDQILQTAPVWLSVSQPIICLQGLPAPEDGPCIGLVLHKAPFVRPHATSMIEIGQPCAIQQLMFNSELTWCLYGQARQEWCSLLILNKDDQILIIALPENLPATVTAAESCAAASAEALKSLGAGVNHHLQAVRRYHVPSFRCPFPFCLLLGYIVASLPSAASCSACFWDTKKWNAIHPSCQEANHTHQELWSCTWYCFI